MQTLVDGLIVGLALALPALGFHIVYRPAGVVFLALGAVYTGAPYLAWQMTASGAPRLVALSGALLASGLFCMACERFNHSRLHARMASSGAHLVSSLAIYLISVATVTAIWGSAKKSLKISATQLVPLGPIDLAQSRLIEAGGAVAVLVLFYVWLRLTRTGLELRALADNAAALAAAGYNTAQLRLLAFCLAGLVTAAGALLAANDRAFHPQNGMTVLLLAIVAVIVGGRRRWYGPVLGAVIVGVLRSQLSWHLSPQWADALLFVLLAGVMTVLSYRADERNTTLATLR